MLTLLFVLLLQAAGAGAPAAPAAEHPRRVGQSCVVQSKGNFTAWPARSEFVLSVSGHSVLYTENGPEGPRLRAYDLSTGVAATLAVLPGPFYGLATIPKDSDHVLLVAEPLRKGPNEEIVKLDLLSGAVDRFDVSGLGFDGSLAVSPDGKYVATGAGLQCFGGGKRCAPDGFAVLSVVDGTVVVQESLPLSPTQRGSRLWLNWDDDGALAVAWEEANGRQAHMAIKRSAKSGWSPVKRDGSTDMTEPGPARMTLTIGPQLGQSRVSLPCGDGGQRVYVDPAALFAPVPGVLTVLEGRRVCVLAKSTPTAPAQDDLVEVLVLKRFD